MEAMNTMTVSLPDAMKAWVEERVKSGSYANASDYVRDLIKRDQAMRNALVEALIAGERGGISQRTVAEIIADTRGRLKNGEL
jgi:antitoxin ParD1/3/4